jgi:hypothetical protein
MLCIATGGHLIAIATTAFTLSWTHSVEHTTWRESWQISGDRLRLVEASVEGPGAGIALPDGARKTANGWTFIPELRPLARLTLAASGMTASGWAICAGETCHELGRDAGGPIQIWAASTCSADPS